MFVQGKFVKLEGRLPRHIVGIVYVIQKYSDCFRFARMSSMTFQVAICFKERVQVPVAAPCGVQTGGL